VINTVRILAITAIFMLPFASLAKAENNIFPPELITCFTDVSNYPYQNHCEGYNENDYQIVNADYSIPRNKIVLFFSDAIANDASYDEDSEFFYHDLQLQYVIILSPANNSIHAKLDDPIWVKKPNSEHFYYCTAKQCPLIKT
jgi:hypothetical protein